MKELSNKPYAVFTRGNEDDYTFFKYDAEYNQFSCMHGGWSGYYKLDLFGKPALYQDKNCHRRIATYDDVHFLTEEEYEKAFRTWSLPWAK